MTDERKDGIDGDDSGRQYVRFPQLSSRTFEHPSDRAALTAMRKVPGFDLLLRKLLALMGERTLRNLYLASAVRVGPKQFWKLYESYRSCADILDIDGEVPELYVSQTPFVNAGAVGVDQPFIVLNSGTLHLLSDEEVRFVLGHELGHILAGHVLYKTMLNMLLALSLRTAGIPLGNMALMAIIGALHEWDRKSELTSDRAGLLCTQDPKLSYSIFMKMAGGKNVEQMNVDAFIEQAEDYNTGGDHLDSLVKFFTMFYRRHPFHVIRLAEAKKWVDEGAYASILAGEYIRRSDEENASLYKDMSESVRSYQDSYAKSKDPLLLFLKDIGQEAKDFSSEVAATGNRMFQKIRNRFTKTDESDHEPETDDEE